MRHKYGSYPIPSSEAWTSVWSACCDYILNGLVVACLCWHWPMAVVACFYVIPCCDDWLGDTCDCSAYSVDNCNDLPQARVLLCCSHYWSPLDLALLTSEHLLLVHIVWHYVVCFNFQQQQHAFDSELGISVSCKCKIQPNLMKVIYITSLRFQNTCLYN